MITQFKLFESYTNIDINMGDVLLTNDIYSYVQELHRKEEDFDEGDIGDRIWKYKRYKVMEIPVDKINMEDYYVDIDYVKEYIHKYKQLGTYPPIVLEDEYYGTYDIIDGTHRANALKRAGLNKILSFVGIK